MFEPTVVKKRQRDIFDIENKIISMYVKGMTTRQISEAIDDIYGFEASEGFISDVMDKVCQAFFVPEGRGNARRACHTACLKE